GPRAPREDPARCAAELQLDELAFCPPLLDRAHAALLRGCSSAPATLAAAASPAARSGAVLRKARASTKAPSSEASIASETLRARAGATPAPRRHCAVRASQLVNTSAHAWRIGSFVLETSSATVAIGHASA